MLNLPFFFSLTTGFICSSVGTCGARTAFSVAVSEKREKISTSTLLQPPAQAGLGTQGILVSPTQGRTAAVNSSLSGGQLGHSTSNSYSWCLEGTCHRA